MGMLGDEYKVKSRQEVMLFVCRSTKPCMPHTLPGIAAATRRSIDLQRRVPRLNDLTTVCHT